MKRLLVFLLVATAISYSQKSSKTTRGDLAKPLNPRQIDFILRLHGDIVEPSSEAASAFFYGAFETDGTKDFVAIKGRFAQGLKNASNLRAIVRYAKMTYGRSASLALDGALPSLDLEECEHLASISELELLDLAKKYARFLSKHDQDVPRY
jgi:hypothetical protein